MGERSLLFAAWIVTRSTRSWAGPWSGSAGKTNSRRNKFIISAHQRTSGVECAPLHPSPQQQHLLQGQLSIPKYSKLRLNQGFSAPFAASFPEVPLRWLLNKAGKAPGTALRKEPPANISSRTTLGWIALQAGVSRTEAWCLIQGCFCTNPQLRTPYPSPPVWLLPSPASTLEKGCGDQRTTSLLCKRALHRAGKGDQLISLSSFWVQPNTAH